MRGSCPTRYYSPARRLPRVRVRVRVGVGVRVRVRGYVQVRVRVRARFRVYLVITAETHIALFTPPNVFGIRHWLTTR